MKTIIAGTRTITDFQTVVRAASAVDWPITEVVSGGCNGVDQLGELVAENRHIPVKIFEADWNMYGRMAGPIRNCEMANYADALILIWDGKSKGSKSMLKEATARNLLIHEVIVDV